MFAILSSNFRTFCNNLYIWTFVLFCWCKSSSCKLGMSFVGSMTLEDLRYMSLMCLGVFGSQHLVNFWKNWTSMMKNTIQSTISLVQSTRICLLVRSAKKKNAIQSTILSSNRLYLQSSRLNCLSGDSVRKIANPVDCIPLIW